MPEHNGSRFVPKNLPDFQQHFPNEEACIAHLYAKRFPTGFLCRYCEQHEGVAGPPYTFAGRPHRLSLPQLQTGYEPHCWDNHAPESATAQFLVLRGLSRNEPNPGNERRPVQKNTRD